MLRADDAIKRSDVIASIRRAPPSGSALAEPRRRKRVVVSMPEGPSIVILREEAASFAGKTILRATGNSKINKQRLVNRRIVALRSWGKHFLIEFAGFAVRIHLLMFGTYRINDRKAGATPRLSLEFADGELNFYTCSVQYIEGRLEDTYDWRTDIMSDEWSSARALKKLRAMPKVLVCDAILDQTVFAGAGNIFKNEVLFRVRVHPLSKVGALPPRKLREMVEQTRVYGGEFLKWKKAFVLRKHWLAHTRSVCPRCDIAFSKGKLGLRQRRSFYCEKCQKRYPVARAAPAKKKTRPATRRKS